LFINRSFSLMVISLCESFLMNLPLFIFQHHPHTSWQCRMGLGFCQSWRYERSRAVCRRSRRRCQPFCRWCWLRQTRR
jgi:hypothetical protein